MPLEMVLTNSNNQLIHRYEAEWTIKNVVTNNKSQSVRSPPFAPIPGISVQFCWEILSYSYIPSNCKTAILHLKLILMKLVSFDVPPSLSMKDMVPLTCIETNLECVHHDSSVNHYCICVKISSNPLRIKSVLKYYGHLSSPLVYCRNMRTLKNQEQFMKDFGLIYNLSSLGDMIILVGEQKLHVHKSVLIAHSHVMRKMLEHEFAESKTNTLTIVDSDYEIFECFLKFLYSGQIEDKSWSTLKQLYILADKYDVKTLQMQCAIEFEDQMSMDNLCEILKLTYEYNEQNGNIELKQKAKQFAAINFTELVSGWDWKAMVLSHPEIGCDVITMIYQPQIPVPQDTCE